MQYGYGKPLYLLLACLLAALAGCAANTHQALPSSGLVRWHQGKALMPEGFAAEVEDIYRRLAASAGVDAPLRINGSPVPNAWAGRRSRDGAVEVVINAGLLDLIGDDPDTIAFVLAHELGHLGLGHLTDEAIAERQNRRGRWELASMLADMIIPFSGLALSAGQGLASAHYSREEELEADRHAVSLLVKAGFDPAGALRFQLLIARISDPARYNLLSSHPPSAERIDAVRSVLAQ